MIIHVLHKPSNRIGILRNASYKSRATGNRIAIELDQATRFIGKENPPGDMRVTIKLIDNKKLLINCKPMDLTQLASGKRTPKHGGCKTIW